MTDHQGNLLVLRDGTVLAGQAERAMLAFASAGWRPIRLDSRREKETAWTPQPMSYLPRRTTRATLTTRTASIAG